MKQGDGSNASFKCRRKQRNRPFVSFGRELVWQKPGFLSLGIKVFDKRRNLQNIVEIM